jgi:DNA polymerase III gamma/tau subunit
MTLRNLAVERDPSNWDEFRFHEKEVQRLRSYLERDEHPFAMILSGWTGSGKTTAARLYIKSLFCLNRQPGESQPCGHCASCKLDPRTAGVTNNILWVQKGQEESLTRQINTAIQEAYQPPNGMDEDHRNYKVIVFDETQSIPKDRLQDLLYYPEVPSIVLRNRVILIFITMNEGGIHPSVSKALIDRCAYHRFRKLSDKEVKNYLLTEFPGIPEESAEIIAHHAEGSLRGALNALETCASIDEYLLPHNVADGLYYVTKNARKRIWSMLRSFDYRALHQFWEENEHKFDETNLIKQMIGDLDKAMQQRITRDQLRAQSILYFHLTTNTRVRAIEAIKQLMGLDLIDIEKVKQPRLEQTGYERMEGLLTETKG